MQVFEQLVVQWEQNRTAWAKFYQVNNKKKKLAKCCGNMVSSTFHVANFVNLQSRIPE